MKQAFSDCRYHWPIQHSAAVFIVQLAIVWRTFLIAICVLQIISAILSDPGHVLHGLLPPSATVLYLTVTISLGRILSRGC